MRFEIEFTPTASQQMDELESFSDKANICKAVHKTLAYMQMNLRHPSLNTHEFKELKGYYGEKVFESYVQNRTPGAYRILWHYGPELKKITVIAVIPHP